jgi:tetratricopeptide (TPR) repeat protein
MKIRSKALVLASLLPALAGLGCTRVQAKSAFRDGNKAYKEENYKKAIPFYERAAELDPEMAEANFYLGSAHQALYRPGKEAPDNKQHLELAIENFKKSLEKNAGSTENQKKVKANTLAALIGIYSEDPFKSYDDAKLYADRLVAENPNDSKNLFAMAALLEKFGKVAEAEEMYKKVVELNPNDVKACGALAAFYNKALWDDQGSVWAEGSDRPRRARFDQAIGTLERCASLAPNDAGGFQKIATFYWDKAYRDPLLSDKQKDEYADKGLENVDKALQIKPDYFEAIIYKGLVYRVKASVTKNPRERQGFLERAAELQKQGLDLKKQQAAEQASAAAAAAAAAASPSP